MRSLFGAVMLSLLLMAAGPGQMNAGWLDQGLSVLGSVTGESKTAAPVSALSNTDITRGFQEALRIGSGNVVGQLGKSDGFNADPAVRIPLPDNLKRVRDLLAKVGLAASVDDLELKLNRAAEAALPKAKPLFVDAISAMTFDDVRSIYEGPDDAATRYFQGKMTPALSREMEPVINESLAQVGAVQAYDLVMGQYRNLPFVPDVKADLTKHVTEKGLDGLFYYLAQEEAAIRSEPVKQTTELLKRVFGQ
ncbi:MAG: DUF4197 domain-containing protein [Desulfobulbaceae bacterium]|uniref:DUF4197 domain-containing protein n=1 Tax=Candidatus Desulfatifera sulfidica TaxID=2841691 RepID=A0A8J6TAP4_9BACT|nr:DUF4197 domain-containing protein [Candidatus Desulfatifera sulfidica]